ncbi:MAG TPA: RNA pseudouridine synthase [Candidatus Saccharimonadia bacterium]|nr:RNA pseudouridine synthase [Candidatus Saccharimonadia bacterium]
MPQPLAASYHFTVLEETDEWLAVNKPAPLQIHPSKPSDAGLTLWDGLRELLRYELVNGGQVSLINRLDRETSGVVLVAKTSRTARELGKAMMRRQMRKTYLAIVHGWPEWDRLEVNQPILRQGEVMESRVWVQQRVHPDGAPCLTGFRVMERFEKDITGRGVEKFALIEAEPHTGRMHQIRVHLQFAGHPIVGDKLYGVDEGCYLEFMETNWTPSLESRLILPRQALHSHVLEVKTPDREHRWTAPLTADLESFMVGGGASLAS